MTGKLNNTRLKIFIDSANIDEIEKANEWGIIDGVTTNPTLIKKENKNFEEIIKNIIDIVKGPINIEAVGIDTDTILKEAIKMSELSNNIVIKIPMTPNGLKVVQNLYKKDIKTNVTLIFSVNQAILAAKAGATYISPFIGRLDDIGHDGMQIIRDTAQIFDIYNFETEIIVASIRHPLHITDAAKIGADIVTVPFTVIEKMFGHPLTDIGIKKFNDDWEKIINR